MAYKRKTASSERVPVEIVYALRYGKQAYLEHPNWNGGPDPECADIYLVCGKLINDREYGPAQWMRYRSELMKRPDIRRWWAYLQYEIASSGGALPPQAVGGNTG